jgi:aminoglycoside phosphotransferase (APT) family kinase protein
LSETVEVREGEAFDREAVEDYLRSHVEDLPEGELEVSQFPSGASNLTYLLKLGDWEGVLRRPPLGPVPPKAHDMGRESGILFRLGTVYPLVPRPYFFCEDESVIGAPFYVMERRKGVVIDDSLPEGIEPDGELCRGISRTVVDTLVGFPRASDGRLDLPLRQGENRRDRGSRTPDRVAGPRGPREPASHGHPQRLQAKQPRLEPRRFNRGSRRSRLGDGHRR